MLSAIDQSFSVHFRLMQTWTFDCVCSSSLLMSGCIQVGIFYTDMHYVMISCVTEGCEYSAKQICTVTLPNAHHTYYMPQ